MRVTIKNEEGLAWLTLTANAQEVHDIDAHYRTLGYHLGSAECLTSGLSIQPDHQVWLSPDGSGLNNASCEAVMGLVSMQTGLSEGRFADSIASAALTQTYHTTCFNLAVFRVKLFPDVPLRMQLYPYPISAKSAAIVFTALGAAYRVAHEAFTSRTVEIKVTLTTVAEAVSTPSTEPAPQSSEEVTEGLRALFG
jgi:hypothetical protein